MTPLNPTAETLGSQPLTPPPGIELRTQEQEDLFRATLEFERFFVAQMMKDMQKSASLLGGDDDSGAGGSTSGYNDMAQDQLVQSVLDGGGLGLAGILYTQVGAATGISDLPGSDGGSDAGDAGDGGDGDADDGEVAST